MEKHLGSYTDESYAILRIMAGAFFTCPGLQKIFGCFGGSPDMAPFQFWTAGLIELIGGLMITLGIYTSWAAFLASGLMAFAFFLVHFGFPDKILPITNHGEKAALYSFIFLHMACKGNGIWSLERLLPKR